MSIVLLTTMSYSIRYHGNYCGPGWSNGKRQSSVIGDTPPVDDFDATCMLHDAAYATSQEASVLTQADYEFATSNLASFNPKRMLAGALVGVQGLLRGTDSNIATNQTKMTNLRGNAAKKTKSNKQPGKAGATISTVPASYGFSLKMTPPKIRRSGDTAHITGSDFAGNCITAATAHYQPAASIFLNPAYFQNAMLGSMARAYEKYRFVKATVHYIPSVPTTTQGQLVMCSTRTVKEPFFDGSSSTFLSRALSQGNALATPLWKEAALDVPCSSEWSIVDALLDSDLDDCIQEEVQCYATADYGGTAGIFMLHYEIEFKDPLYTYHPTLIPVPIGNGASMSAIDNSAVNAVGDAIALIQSTGPTWSVDQGSIYRLIFRREASISPVGPTSWNTVANVVDSAALSATLTGTQSTATSLPTGTVLYGKIMQGSMYLYTDYDTATAGEQAGVLTYRTATTGTGTWQFHFHLVRMSNTLRITNQ